MGTSPEPRLGAPMVLFALAIGGCYRGGTANADADGDASGGSDTDGDTEGDETAGDTDAAGCGDEASIAPLRRLSEAQYRNTLRDLFAPAGVDVETEALDELDRIPADDAGATFGILDVRVSDLHARAYYRLANRLADLSAHDHLAEVAGECALAAAPDAACIDAFLDDFGMRVYRRPLTAEEREQYHALASEAPDGPEAFRTLVFSLLLTPQFLYHVQVEGEGDDTRFDLDGWALASRLSFHFWQTMPDAELFAAAADGSLVTEEGYLAQLDRVFADPRTQVTVDRFYDEWLQLGWLTQFPTTPAFATFAEGTSIGDPEADHLAAAREEIHALVRHFTFVEDGTIADLFLTDLSLTTSPHLAELYGVQPWDGTSEPPHMPSGERAGLLTRVAFLLTGDQETHPVHRGAAVQRRILCADLPQPDPTSLPPGALDKPPVTEDQTTRQRYEVKTADPTCATCHTLINPTGFVLERYDAIGRFRSEERVIDEATGEVIAVLPIDSSAAPNLAGDDAVIDSGAALSEQVVASGQAEACFARQYFRATFGREEADEDACALERVEDSLVEEGSMRAALRSIALDPVFRSRRVN